MTSRIVTAERGNRFEILVDGEFLTAFPGETVAAVMLAARQVVFRRDDRDAPRTVL